MTTVTDPDIGAAFDAPVTRHDDVGQAGEIARLRAENERLRERLDRIADQLQPIITWGDAYPERVFCELRDDEFRRVRMALEDEDTGISLDRVSASNMRYVATRCAEVARAALKETSHE